MNLTNVNVYAEGDYSGQTHEENIMMRTETFEKLSDEILKLRMWFYDLDGKHSEAKGEISIEHYTEEDLINMNLDFTNDGERLDERLEELFEDAGIDYMEEQSIVRNYLEKLDTFTEITVSVKKSQRQIVLDFVSRLNL